MDKKNLIYIGVGVVVAYFLFSYLKKSKETTETTESTADQAKIDKCNKEVDDYMAMSRFASGADLEAIRKAKFDACMSGSEESKTPV